MGFREFGDQVVEGFAIVDVAVGGEQLAGHRSVLEVVLEAGLQTGTFPVKGRKGGGVKMVAVQGDEVEATIAGRAQYGTMGSAIAGGRAWSVTMPAPGGSKRSCGRAPISACAI